MKKKDLYYQLLKMVLEKELLLVDDYRKTNRGGQGVANIECSS